jgi:hypothetical protein
MEIRLGGHSYGMGQPKEMVVTACWAQWLSQSQKKFLQVHIHTMPGLHLYLSLKTIVSLIDSKAHGTAGDEIVVVILKMSSVLLEELFSL